jgi:hypothetical protein
MIGVTLIMIDREINQLNGEGERLEKMIDESLTKMCPYAPQHSY